MALTNIETTIILDLYDHDTTPTKIKAIQLDSNTRYVSAVICNRSGIYDVGQTTGVTLTIIRPDKVGVQITGETVAHTETTPDEQTITTYGAYAELSLVALAVKGNLKAQFMLKSGDQVLRTEIFTISCGEALDASTDTWAGEYQGYNLDELVQNVNESVAKVDAMEQDVTELKEDLEHTNNGNGLLSLGNIILMSGGNNTSTKAVRTNDYISDDIVKIIAKENKFALILCAYDGNNNNAYVGHSYGNGTDLISTNSEGTHVYSIDMREWRAAYPNYKWRLSAHSKPWREITLEEAYQYFSFVYLNIVSRDKFDEYKANDVLAQKNVFAFFPANTKESYYITEGQEQTEPNENIWVKFYPYVLFRGVGSDVTLSWTDLMTRLSNETFETSPDGASNCLVLSGNKILALNINTKNFEILSPNNLYENYPQYIIFAQCWNGRIIRGVILDGYMRQFTRETNVRFDYCASMAKYAVPASIESDIVGVNRSITYDHPNDIKIGWVTDVHTGGNGENKPIDYCTELTKYGQISAYMITGDLNYYISEGSVQGTEEMMSTVARHISEMLPYTKPLPCRGNHDGVVGETTYSYQMFTDAVIKPFVSEYGAHGQYYYDIDSKIRIIMLNSCIDSQARKGFSTDQIAWIQTVLANTPAGYGVIVAAHHPINADFAGSTPSNNLPSYYNDLVLALQSFKSTRSDCDLIGYFFGHMHHDYLGVKDGFIQCGLIDSSTDQSDFSSDIICIDTENKIVNLIRLGEGDNRSFGYGGNNLRVIT